ncbi:nuclear transport factor 2 family protein [Natronorubrum sp. FCH18a]|uniref:nuclear transport factor 2 family protein n=1 Tax=Natronorubrum sp. FCH18a TaxID=3447018 RepID=UPI003F518624
MARDDVKIVEQFLDAAGEGDMDTVVEMSHPDYIMREPESLSYGGTYESVPDLFADMDAAYEDFSWDLQWVTQAGDQVLCYVSVEGTPTGGTAFESTAIELIRVEDGLIIEEEVFYRDTEKILQASQ